jgi:hypothetical protein
MFEDLFGYVFFPILCFCFGFLLGCVLMCLIDVGE